jgi:ATP-dependent helicase YprA (DUF1998 family)
MVEVLTKYLKDVFDHDPRKPARVRAYRGGYLPDERRLTEKLMRQGAIDAIVSTSALELGVDIGSLDVALLCGYPGSIAATRQRLGRAGRRQQSALGVMVASSDALDQFVCATRATFWISRRSTRRPGSVADLSITSAALPSNRRSPRLIAMANAISAVSNT